MISTSRFPNIALETLYNITIMFITQTLWSLDMMLSYFYPVTTEWNDPAAAMHVAHSFIFVPIYAVLFVLSGVVTLPFIPIWWTLQWFRKPYFFSCSQSEIHYENINLKYKYSLCSTNLCLISEFIARMSNLKDVLDRAQKIGQRIAASQEQSYANGISNHGDEKRENLPKTGNFEYGTSTQFPSDLDFICFQEVSDTTTEAGKELSSHLHQAGYHYFLYDVGVHKWKLNRYLLSSWLSFASKYPILNVAFHPYEYKSSGHQEASVGLLLVKYSQKSMVYGPGPSYLMSKSQDLDSILFVGEKGSWSHHLFDVYHDVCRDKPGKNFDWVRGTELRLCCTYDEEISTPKKLKAVMDDQYARPRYFLDGNVEVTMTQEISWTPGPKKEEFEKGQRKLMPVEGTRKIDYVLYKREFPVDVSGLYFVTQLAGLTDHIPVCMTFSPTII
ncbi:sphingomyelin phosphodiesterase 3-like [Saccoglossus kowalevskii]